jgi:hypothetical protein
LIFSLNACAGEPRGACVPKPAPGEIGTVCGFENPEDVEAVADGGLVLVSEIRLPGISGGGAIAALPIDEEGFPAGKPRRLWPTGADASSAAASEPVVGDPGCQTPPDRDSFAPHGLTHAQSGADVWRVAVVAHGRREAIELFDLNGTGEQATLHWRGCVPLPADAAGNDVALGPDGTIFASKYQPTMSGVLGLYYMLKGGLGFRTGNVMAWSRKGGWGHLAGTDAANPNGVLVRADPSVVFFAETGTGKVARVPLSGRAPAGRRREVNIGGHPDNLSWSSRDTILVATHLTGVGFLGCAFGRLPCGSPWAIFEIDPEKLGATELLRYDGSAVGAVASATEINGTYYFGAVFDDRIGVWQPQR